MNSGTTVTVCHPFISKEEPAWKELCRMCYVCAKKRKSRSLFDKISMFNRDKDDDNSNIDIENILKNDTLTEKEKKGNKNI